MQMGNNLYTEPSYKKIGSKSHILASDQAMEQGRDKVISYKKGQDRPVKFEHNDDKRQYSLQIMGIFSLLIVGS